MNLDDEETYSRYIWYSNLVAALSNGVHVLIFDAGDRFLDYTDLGRGVRRLTPGGRYMAKRSYFYERAPGKFNFQSRAMPLWAKYVIREAREKINTFTQFFGS